MVSTISNTYNVFTSFTVFAVFGYIYGVTTFGKSSPLLSKGTEEDQSKISIFLLKIFDQIYALEIKNNHTTLTVHLGGNQPYGQPDTHFFMTSLN